MAFPTNITMEDTLPPYIIYRDAPPGQQYDPAAPPVFFPPKDSDELFDALRIAFPSLKSHSDRMREAMIKFLLEERQAEQFISPSPMQQSWPSMSSSGSTSTFSSPETFDLATPGMSPVPRLTRQFSTAPSITTTSTEPSPPALEHMTGVFSVSATGQPKQRIRRKMTEAEKIDYRKRRIVKACDKCSKRKRKCNHNQPEMETLASKQRVTKPRNTAKTPEIGMKQENELMDFENFMFDDMQLFDDFTYTFEDPTLQQQKSFDHLLGVDANVINERAHGITNGQSQWRIVEGQDWSMPDSQSLDQLQSPTGFQNTTAGRNLQTGTSANHANSNEAMRFDQIQSEADRIRGEHHPHKLFSTINQRGQPQAQSETGKQEPSGNGMLWEHLRTGQIQPTHTLHAHDGEGHGAYVYDSAGRAGTATTGISSSRASLPSSVLQLTGTAKAIRAFGRKLKSNGPRSIALQLLTLSSVVSVVAEAQHAHGHTDEHLLDAKPPHPHAYFGLKQSQLDMFAALDGRSPIPQLLRNTDELGADASSIMLSEPAADGPLEGMTIGDYLRMQTNFDDLNHQLGRGGQALQSCIQDTAKQASSEDKTAASTSVPFVHGSLTSESIQVQQEGRPAPALDGSIERATGPGGEPYMLKRRMGSGWQSIVDKSNSATAPTPLPRTRMESEKYEETPPSRGTMSNDQANGGAYLRLDTDNFAQPILGTDTVTGDPTIDQMLASAGNRGGSRLDIWANPGRAHHQEAHLGAEEGRGAGESDVPVNTRTRSPANFNGDTDGRQNQGELIAAAHAENAQNAQTALQVTAAGMRQNEDVVTVDRNRDTFRCRDHFGRDAFAQLEPHFGSDALSQTKDHFGRNVVPQQEDRAPSYDLSQSRTWRASGAGRAVGFQFAFAVLSGLALFALSKLVTTVDPSLLLLALAYPVSDSTSTLESFSNWFCLYLFDARHWSTNLHFLFCGTRYWQEEATHDAQAYTWIDAKWPGTSGESEQRRPGRVRAGAFTRSGGFWPKFLAGPSTVQARFGQWRRGFGGLRTSVETHGRFGRCGGPFPRFWGGLRG